MNDTALFPNPDIFKAYDIRGIYGTEITDENFSHIIKAIYAFFTKTLNRDHLQVVLGRDMRVFSETLSDIAAKTLTAAGAHVIDIGLAPTPTFYLASLKYGYDVGIHVTASHNPPEYAGTKFVIRKGETLMKIGKGNGMEEIAQCATISHEYVSETHDGTLTTRNDILENEVQQAFEALNIRPEDIKPLKAVADPANGMGALYLEKLYEHIPGELIRMNFALDGTFPAHEANPLKFETLKSLQERVIQEKADIGIAPDGDGDRVFFINEKGEIIEATLITSLIAHEAVKTHPGATIIADIRYVRNVSEVVKSLGGTVHISRVGHAYITQDVNQTGAFFAGESSGHFYFGSLGGAESAIRVILYVLSVMSREQKPISEILKSLKTSIESGEFNFLLPETVSAKNFLQELAKEYADAEISWLDGIAVTYPEWRFNIRTSNTEPAIRLNVEAKSEEMVNTKKEELINRILSTGAKPKK